MASFRGKARRRVTDSIQPKLPDGVLDYREYFFEFDGKQAGIGFTLDDLESDTEAVRYAREFGADAFGMVFLFHIPNSPRHPVLWLQRGKNVGLQPAGSDDISDGMRLLIGPHLSQFFADIAPEHPQLADQLTANGLLGPGSLPN
jgi:hypothetical protein